MQEFLSGHASRMNAETDKRLVMVCAQVAQLFTNLHDQLKAASAEGAALNVALGASPVMTDAEAALYAHEFLAVCSTLALGAVAKELELQGLESSIVEDFKAKYWHDEAPEITN